MYVYIPSKLPGIIMVANKSTPERNTVIWYRFHLILVGCTSEVVVLYCKIQKGEKLTFIV